MSVSTTYLNSRFENTFIMKDKLLYTIKVGYMVYRLRYADDDEANLRQNIRKNVKAQNKVKKQVVARASLLHY